MAKPDKTAGKKKKNVVKVNFAGVETRAHITDGSYHAKVAAASLEDGNAAQYIKWTFEIVSDDKANGRKLYYNTSLAPQALWNLRNLLETLGVETPDSETSLDLDGYIDLELMVRVESEVYEGKERPKVTDFTPLEETTTTAEDDDEETTEEEEDEEDEEDEAPAKPAKKPAKKEEPEEEAEEEEDAEEEAEEEADEEEKLTADEVREMETDELTDLIKKHKLKVDLTKISKASKRIAAVIDALEAKDLLG